MGFRRFAHALFTLVFRGAHQTYSRCEKQKTENTENQKWFNAVSAAGAIGKQDGRINQAANAKEGEQTSKNSFNVHDVFVLPAR